MERKMDAYVLIWPLSYDYTRQVFCGMAVNLTVQPRGGRRIATAQIGQITYNIDNLPGSRNGIFNLINALVFRRSVLHQLLHDMHRHGEEQPFITSPQDLDEELCRYAGTRPYSLFDRMGVPEVIKVYFPHLVRRNKKLMTEPIRF